ncbi:unnamed protein product, partial [Discosporangium mesarthrocarpum]
MHSCKLVNFTKIYLSPQPPSASRASLNSGQRVLGCCVGLLSFLLLSCRCGVCLPFGLLPTSRAVHVCVCVCMCCDAFLAPETPSLFLLVMASH